MSNESTPSQAAQSPETETSANAAATETVGDSQANEIAASQQDHADSPEQQKADGSSAPAVITPNPTESDDADAERVSVELMDPPTKTTHAPPPPRSLRPKGAKDLVASPLGVTAKLPAPVWPPTTVADLMTRKIITVAEQEPIGNLEDLMEKFEFRHLPVVEVGMKLVGLITRTDLLHAELGRMPDGTPAPKIDGGTLAGVIMRKNVVFARLDTPIATACRVMSEKKLTCIPVVLEDHTLVGILTVGDIVKFAARLLDGLTDSKI